VKHVISVSPEGLDWIAALEGGYRLEAYLCPAGVWTISAGVTRYLAGHRVKQRDRLIDEAEAKKLFAGALRHYERGVDALTRDDLAQHEFDALVSFAYNVGVEVLARSTLVRRVNARAAVAEIRRQLLRWRYADVDPDRPGLEEVRGLLLRRLAEAEVYAGNGYLTQDDVARRVGGTAA
jgi:lysozyme